MELAQLQSFLQAARSGSFRSAARAMYLSQPSLSGRIRSLERELRDAALPPLGPGRAAHRSRRDVPAVRRAGPPRPWTWARKRSATPRRPEKNTLTIGSARIIGTYILPPTLERFQHRHPGVSARIRTGRSSDVIEMVANGVVDIGLSRGLLSRADVLLRSTSTMSRSCWPPIPVIPSPAGDRPTFPRWPETASHSLRSQFHVFPAHQPGLPRGGDRAADRDHARQHRGHQAHGGPGAGHLLPARTAPS